jgi:hypothetical protein
MVRSQRVFLARTLLDAFPAGSYFVLTQPTADFDPPAMAATAEQSSRTSRAAAPTCKPCSTG